MFSSSFRKRPLQKVPLDSIRAVVPPLYRLNWVEGNPNIYGRWEPTTPIQMLPVGVGAQVDFQFWGLKTYDIHVAFDLYSFDEFERIRIYAINYQVIVLGGGDKPSISAHYLHRFKSTTEVYMGLLGISSSKRIFELHPALEHLPKLPNGWQYMQFIN